MPRLNQYRLKRPIDLLLVALAAPVLLPLGTLIAGSVRVTMGSPVFFAQERAGLHGRTFKILKFRTMTSETDSDGKPLSDRQRLTKTGKLLRRSSLDEIPQLINVAKGDMSLIGPRPLFPRYVPYYSDLERTRHNVRPGITGLAQISGRNELGWRQRLALDAEYVKNISLPQDAWILMKTLQKVTRSSGISSIAGDTGLPLDAEREYPSHTKHQLRPLYRRDLVTRVEWMNDARIRKYMTLPEEITLATTAEWYKTIQSDGTRREFVVESTTGEVVAMTGLRSDSSRRSAEFYLFVHPELHGEGIGTIATDLTIEWWRSSDHYTELTLTVAASNKAARAIYERKGFRITRETETRIWMSLTRGKEVSD